MQLKNALADTNEYSQIIYGAPVVMKNKPIITRLLTKIKQKIYYKKEVLRCVKHLRDNTASFQVLCDFADFIKQMELSMFFNNSISNRDNTNRVNIPEKEKKNIIICDSKISNSTKEKVIRILMEKENVIITFSMSYSDSDDEIVDVNVRNNFGSKVVTNFHIVNHDMEFDSIHSYNLLNNVNIILQNTMADTFLEIYKESIKRV